MVLGVTKKILSLKYLELSIPYSLNISRGKIFADFAVLGVISENFTPEIFRPPYSLIHFGSVCKSVKILFLATFLNLEIFRLYGTLIHFGSTNLQIFLF